jgi:uncharacterized membrane protein YkvA (DUF1232 family)
VFGIPLLQLIIAIVVLTIGAIAGLLWLTKTLEKREPYKSFMQLRTREKVSFFRLLITDRRVPKRVKLLPFLLVPYLAMPIDIVPDFIPVLGYLDDVAIVLGTFALVIRLTPRAVIDDLFSQIIAARKPAGA